MGQICYPSESWVFKSRFSFKVILHGQQQFYIQYKVCWILYRMICALSLSKPFLCIKITFQSPPRIRFSTSVNFYLPIPPLLVHNIFLTIPSSIPQQLFTSLFLRTTIPTIYTRNIFPTSDTENWHSCNFSLLLQSMESDSKAHGYWFSIVQVLKIGVL